LSWFFLLGTKVRAISRQSYYQISVEESITESKNRTDIFLASQVSDMEKRIFVDYIDVLISWPSLFQLSFRNFSQHVVSLLILCLLFESSYSYYLYFSSDVGTLSRQPYYQISVEESITESKDRTDIFLASQVSDMKKRISVNYIDFLISVYLNWILNFIRICIILNKEQYHTK
jgi:hypothetical protein